MFTSAIPQQQKANLTRIRALGNCSMPEAEVNLENPWRECRHIELGSRES